MKKYLFNPGKKNSLSLTVQLIIVNLFLYIVGMFLFAIYGEGFLTQNIALNPSFILQGGKLWTFITSIFMHGGFFHIFANMFSLFFIGGFLERIIGRKRFFWIYIISGLIGGVFFVLFSYLLGDVNVSAVGASGAIFGLLGVLAVLVPKSKVYLIAGPLIIILAEVLIGPILPESFAAMFNFLVNLLILLMIFSLFSFRNSLRKIAVPVELPMWLVPIIAIIPLSIISLFVELPIGNSAHFGGLVAGLVYGFYLRKKFPRKVKFLGRRFK